MKNKKIITRILTLLASVVLVLVFTIPCFADEPTISNAEMWELFYDNDELHTNNLAYQSLHADGFNDIPIINADNLYSFQGMLTDFSVFYRYGVFVNIPDINIGDDTLTFDTYYQLGRVTLTYINGALQDTVAHYDFETVEVDIAPQNYIACSFYNPLGDVSLEIVYAYDDSLYAYTCDSISLNNDQYLFEASNGTLNSPYRIDICCIASASNMYISNDLVMSFTDDNYYMSSPHGFSLGYTNGFTDGYTTNRPDGVVPPAKTGLFGQLYYILSDAIYGENVELGSSQDFILTQMATWLTYIVVLLPILVVAIILWRVFVR